MKECQRVKDTFHPRRSPNIPSANPAQVTNVLLCHCPSHKASCVLTLLEGNVSHVEATYHWHMR